MIDTALLRHVVWILGGCSLILLGGIVYTSISGKQIDAGLSALAGSCLGYLGGVLQSRRTGAAPDPNTAQLTMPTDPGTTANLQVSQTTEKKTE